jgi:hypothetical protein
MNRILGFSPDQHSFFDNLVTMLMSLSSYMFTLHVAKLSNNPKEFKDRTLNEWISYIAPLKMPEYPIKLETVQLNQSYIFFPFEIISHITLDSWPTLLEYQLGEVDKSISYFNLTSKGNSEIIARIVGTSYVNYYESQKRVINNKHGSDFLRWPDTLNIARHIRNGFSHGGKFYITDPNISELKWRGYTVDCTSHNKNVLLCGNGLSPGDIILLMDDINKLL